MLIIARHGTHCMSAQEKQRLLFFFSPPHLPNESMNRQILSSAYIILRITPYSVDYYYFYQPDWDVCGIFCTTTRCVHHCFEANRLAPAAVSPTESTLFLCGSGGGGSVWSLVPFWSGGGGGTPKELLSGA